jgi:hypothetical protein
MAVLICVVTSANGEELKLPRYTIITLASAPISLLSDFGDVRRKKMACKINNRYSQQCAWDCTSIIL